MRVAAVHLPLPSGDLRKGQVVVSRDFYKNVYRLERVDVSREQCPQGAVPCIFGHFPSRFSKMLMALFLPIIDNLPFLC